MDLLIRLIVSAFAAFRLAEMLVIDDGPFEIFISLRGWFNASPDDPRLLRRTIANGLMCVHCVGVWVSFPLAFLMLPPGPLEFVAYWLAIAGLQSLFAGNLGRTK